MPISNVVLRNGNSGVTVSELHTELSKRGVVIAPSELTAKNFGSSTAAAVRAIRQQYGLPEGELEMLSSTF
jgi:hypothetical protein